MKKAKLKKSSLTALNDLYIVEEDPMDVYQDSTSGLTADVTQALKDKKLFVPDAYEAFSTKFPCTGTIVSAGDKVRYKLEPGTRVVFARMGVQRYTFEGRTLCDVREADVHGTID
jgi:hypothetical protein